MVCNGGNKTGRFSAGLVKLLFCVSFVYFPVIHISAQQPAALTIPSRLLSEGESFTINITIPDAPSGSIRIEELDFPEELSLVEGPLISTSAGEKDGTVQVEISYSLQSLRAGRAIIPPISISINTDKYQSPKGIIEIKRKAEPRIIPFEVVWEIEKTNLYIGETIAVVVLIEETTEIAFPDSVSVTSPQGGVFEEIEGIGKIRRENIGGMELFSVPVMSYAFTPTQTGEAVIPKAEVSLYGLTVRSEEIVIQVNDLPEPVKKSGAVGNFTFSSEISSSAVKIGETVNLKMRINGEGNLTYLQFPIPAAEGLISTLHGEDQILTPIMSGFSGYRMVRYQYTPENEGKVEIRIPSFSWINPKTGIMRQTEAETYTVTVTSAEKQFSDSTNSQYSLLGIERIKKHEPADAYLNPWSYLWILPGFGILIFSFLRRRYSIIIVLIPLCFLCISANTGEESADFPADLLAAAEKYYETGEIESAVENYERALAVKSGSPGIWYNLSLAYYSSSQYGSAIFSIRKAIMENPMIQLYWDTLEWMESSLSLDRQVEPQRWIHPDIFLISLAVFFNITCGVGSLSMYRKKSRYVIVTILGLVLTLFSMSALVYSSALGRYGSGIVGPETTALRKIPEPDAAKWLVLDEGTAINIKSQAEDFFLVETTYGIEGWLERDDFFWSRKDLIPRSIAGEE